MTGLTPSEKYVVAVAAYNRKGQMIGGSIGHTSSPILAASPLPVALAYGFLAKVVRSYTYSHFTSFLDS